MANAPKKRSYEEQWQQAFEQAEMPPSSNIWKNIDQQLTAQESGKYKRGFFFYRAVAAALLLCIAGLSWYILSQPDESDTIAAESSTDVSSSNPTIRESDVRSKSNESATVEDRNNNKSTTITNGSEQPASTTGQPFRGSLVDKNTPQTTEEKGNSSEKLTKSADQSADKTLIFPYEEVSSGEETLLLVSHRVGRISALPPDALALNPPTWINEINKLYYVPQYRKKKPSQSERRGTQFFAGVAMAPSFFDPNLQPIGQSNLVTALAASPQSDALFSLTNYEAAGYRSDKSGTVAVLEEGEGLDNQSSLSFSYGFDLGLTLGEHWSIESGLDYQNFQTITETRYTVVDLQSGRRYPLLATNAQASQATFANTTSTNSPSEVDNQFQFISVPLRVGYNVHFSKITLSVSPGIAANLFLGNRISSDEYSPTSLESDSDSPFDSRYVSGLISGGIFYRLLENYSLSFTPSYQFALSNLAKSSADFSSQPQFFGLKFGFRYNFQ